MPYIPEYERGYLDLEIDALASYINGDPGKFNYVVTALAIAQAKESGGNYEALRGVVGDLESAKLEFYRRRVAPYEDQKIHDNGDVY